MSGPSYLHPSPSNRKRFSREGFQPLSPDHNKNMAPNDATIDIPLEQVPTLTNSGLRSGTAPAAARTNTLGQSPSAQNTSFFRGRRAKRDPAANKTGRIGYDGEEDTLTTAGKLYNKVFGFNIITRYFIYVLPLGLMIAAPIIVGAIILHNHPNNPPKLAGVPIVWFFTWVEIVWLSLWVSKIVAHVLPWLFQVFVGVVSSGVRKYATVLRKLEIPISLVGWAVTSLATFIPLMTRNPWNRAHDPNQKQWETIVQEILGAFVACSLVLLAEKTIIQLISINYHRKQFNARIKESKRHVYILGLLYDASRALFPAYCNEFAEEDYIIADQLQIAKLGGKKRAHKRTGSTTPLRLIQDIGRVGDKLTSAFGDVAQEITGKEVFNPNSSHSVVVEALEKKVTAEALARRIWMSFVEEGRESLTKEDVSDVLGPERGEEADEAFWVLDRDANGDVSLDEMIMTVAEWARERKAIATSMVDVAQAINVLDRLLMAVVTVAVIFIFVAFLNRSFVTTLATAGTALLSLSFVFSVTCQEVLGSCIFLFVKHPFDIGDRVDIGDNHFVVEHISLLFTVFRRVSGVKTGQLCQYANIVLNTLALENVSRSKAMTEQVTLDISFDTSFSDVQILKNELKNFVNDPNNSRDFQSELDIQILGTTDMTKLQLRVEIMHKSNWANETLRSARRSKFMCALVAALRAVPIYAPGAGGDDAGTASNPNYTVTISDLLAKENAKASAEEKEKARLVPVKKIEEVAKALSPVSSGKTQGMAGLSQQDAKVMDDLNARDPASDSAGDVAWSSGRDDTSTLTGGGDRASIDQQDLDDMRGLLRRENTRGKRKAGTEAGRMQLPSIPTINEPGSSSAFGYPPPAPSAAYAGYENQRPAAYSTMPAPYRGPGGRNQSPATQYAPPPPPPAAAAAAFAQGTGEMSQVRRSASQPYGGREEDLSHRPMGSTAGRDEREDEHEFGDLRPYSGV